MSTLNNPKAAQFMGRVASFSTHGSRRGYSDLGGAIDDSQLNPHSERVAILLERLCQIRRDIVTNRQFFGRKATIDSIVNRAKRGVLAGNTLSSALRLGELRDELMTVDAELQSAKQSAKEWNIINAASDDASSARLFVKSAKAMLSEQQYADIWAATKPD